MTKIAEGICDEFAVAIETRKSVAVGKRLEPTIDIAGFSSLGSPFAIEPRKFLTLGKGLEPTLDIAV